MSGFHSGQSCREQINMFLAAYLAGELKGAELTEFQQHMDDCPPCRDYLDSYRKTIECTKKACCHHRNPELAAVPPDLVKAIVAARTAGKPS